MEAPLGKPVLGERDALLDLFASLLAPLMPLALKYGLSARDMSDVSRRAYIQALDARMATLDRPISNARLALTSGLTRSEVALFRDRFQKNAARADRQADRHDRVAAFLSIWNKHPRFSGAYGLALDLELEPTPNSPHRSFSELVEIACPGSSSDSVLDELLAVGAVEIINRSTVRCRYRTVLLNDSDAIDRINRSARCLKAIVGSFAHNIQPDASADSYFERMVVSDNRMSKDARAGFAKVVRERGDEFVHGLDTWLVKSDEPPAEDGTYCGVSVCFFEESEAAHDAAMPGRKVTGKKFEPEEIDVLKFQQRKTREPGDSV